MAPELLVKNLWMKFPIYVAGGSIPPSTRGELEISSEERGVEIKTPVKTVANSTGLKAAGQGGRKVGFEFPRGGLPI